MTLLFNNHTVHVLTIQTNQCNPYDTKASINQ